MSNFRRVDRGRNHTYQLDGRPIDGVTDLISRGLPKVALVGWAAREVATFAADNVGILTNLRRDEVIDLLRGAPWRERDRAAGRGTEVHALAQKLAAGVEVEVPEELVGHVDSYLAWREDWKPTDEVVEGSVLNRVWRYGGTFDLLCRIDGRQTLADLKTTRSGIYAETALQLAAYGHADIYVDADGHEQPMPKIDQYLGIWLRADGYDCFAIDVGDAEWKQFLYTMATARWLDERADRRAPASVISAALPRPQKVAS